MVLQPIQHRRTHVAVFKVAHKQTLERIIFRTVIEYLSVRPSKKIFVCTVRVCVHQQKCQSMDCPAPLSSNLKISALRECRVWIPHQKFFSDSWSNNSFQALLRPRNFECKAFFSTCPLPELPVVSSAARFHLGAALRVVTSVPNNEETLFLAPSKDGRKEPMVVGKVNFHRTSLRFRPTWQTPDFFKINFSVRNF